MERTKVYPSLKWEIYQGVKSTLIKLEDEINEEDILKYGDLLFNTRNSLDLVGKVAVWRSELEKALYNSNLLKISFDGTHVYSSFFMNYLFNSFRVLMRLRAIATGTTSVAAIYNKDVMKLKLPLPPKEEQKRIVKILSTWDEAISKTEKLIKAKKRYKKGLMQRLLSGKVRFPEFVKSEEVRKTRFGIYPKDWEYVKIQDVATQVKGKVGDEREDYTVMSCTKHDGLVSSLEYFDRQVFSKDISNYKVVEKGEFAYATNHVEEGSIGYNNWCEKGAISPMYTVFKADQDKIYNDYLYAIIKTENYRRIFEIFTNGTVNRRGSLRWKDFKKIKVPVPALEEQKAISKVLKKFRQEIQLLEAQLEKYQQQKKGLMQQLLTGKVRVNNLN